MGQRIDAMPRKNQLFLLVCISVTTATTVYLLTKSDTGGMIPELCRSANEQHVNPPGNHGSSIVAGQLISDRDILSYEHWPEKQSRENVPGLLPPVVHYVWCGDKKFRFHDYLSVLSAVKLIEPLKLIFHYTHLPQTDSYNTWFQELKASIAGLELRQLSPAPACGSKDLLQAVMGALSTDGGVLIGTNVLLARFPKQFTGQTNSFFAFAPFAPNSADKTKGIAFTKSSFDEAMKNSYLETIEQIASSKNENANHCVTVEAYNARPYDAACVILNDVIINPRDVIEAQTPFAELARWLFYGSRAAALPKQDFENPIPRISHFIRLKGSKKPEDRGMYNKEFSFNHMVNILSALYVAGFERVFLHLEGEEPRGRWWEEVKKERNVTVMKAVRPSSVFQTKVNVVQHVSDVLRYLTVYKYGGAYQDFDVTWATRLPDSLLAYPAVAGMEWEQKDKEWPESFNLGVILARPRAQWLRHYIETHKDFRDNDWGFNSLRMSYKTYELYPHQLLLDRKLQVICCSGTCHPAWEKPDYRRNGVSDKRPTMPFSWQEVRAVHVTCPKPHPSLASPNAVKIGKDMFAEIGRNVLIKSGRQHLIS